MANQFTLKNGGYEPFIGNYGLVPQPPIPTPESTDNGKVLGVSEGQYALVSGGGGGGSVEPLNVTITEGTSNKTFKQIKDAIDAGTPVIVSLDEEMQEPEGATAHRVTNCTEYGVETYPEVHVGDGDQVLYYVMIRLEYYTTDSENGYPSM